MNERLTAALSYAGRGWRVCPLHWPVSGPSGVTCSCGGRTCDSIGKHPTWHETELPNGILDATTDEERLRRWWQRWPRANIAVATGAGSGLFAVDVDPRHDGGESLAALERTHGKLPETVRSLTGGGGDHHLFRHPGGRVQNRTGKGALAPGLEIKGDEGYIVVPPSTHASGTAYTWEATSHPDDVALAAAPAWLLGMMRDTKPDPLTGAAANGTIAAGSRNDTLTSLAGSMRRRGLEPSEIEAALQAVNERRCTPPLDRSEVSEIAAGMARYAPEEATTWRVGGRRNGAFTGIDPLRKIGSDPPRYEATVLGEKIQLAVPELMEFKRFKVACLARLNFIPVLPPPEEKNDKTPAQARWEQEFLAPAVRVMKEQNDFEEAPEDAGAFGAAWESVLLFLKKMQPAERKDLVYDDKLYFEDGRYLFRGRILRKWLAANRLDTLKEDELWAVVRNHGGKSILVRTPQGVVRVWEVPQPAAPDEA